MGVYRESRNIEATLIEFIQQKLTDDNWSSINVVKTLNQAYRQDLPVICIRVPDKVSVRKEIGSNELRKFYTVYIDIFGSDDGIKLDLGDWFIEAIKNGCTYYQFTTTQNAQGHYEVTDRTSGGKLELLNITSDRNLDFGEGAEEYDKHRRFISFVMKIQ